MEEYMKPELKEQQAGGGLWEQGGQEGTYANWQGGQWEGERV